MTAEAPSLAWSEPLSLQHGVLDATHRGFIEQLNQLSAQLHGGQDPNALYDALLAHTEAHFAMEERWMLETGFAAENCHSKQHATILEVMRMVQAHTRATGDLEPMQRLLPELIAWFPDHVDTLDAALVFHMGQMGYAGAADAHLQPLPPDAAAGPLTGCGAPEPCAH